MVRKTTHRVVEKRVMAKSRQVVEEKIRQSALRFDQREDERSFSVQFEILPEETG